MPSHLDLDPNQDFNQGQDQAPPLAPPRQTPPKPQPQVLPNLGPIPIAKTSESISALATALAAAQLEIKAPLKNRDVDFTDKNGRRVKYAYADLADLIEALRPLAKHGIAVTHQLEQRGTQFYLETRLIHSSGEWLATNYPLPNPNGMRPQEFGSALTYARRYSLSPLAGTASEEDDDGQAAAGITDKGGKGHAKTSQPGKSGALNQNQGGQPQDVGKKTVGGLTDLQLSRLFAVADEAHWKKEDVKSYMDAAFNVASSRNLNATQYQILIQTIQTTGFPEALLSLKHVK